MAMEKILNVMASSLSAESIRMNISASNLANAGTIGSDEDSTYHAKHPIFSEVKDMVNGLSQQEQPTGGVRVTNVMENNKPLSWRIEPDNPMADKDGRIYLTDVNPVEEMSDIISASKQYQGAVEVMKTTKNLLLHTLKAINSI